MTKFRNQLFQQRLEMMGDLAEGKFDDWCALNGMRCVSFGWNRPNLKYFPSLPKSLKYMPDKLIEGGNKDNHFHSFVEVKRCGKDEVFKLKYYNLQALRYWERILPVNFAFYNHHSKSICYPISLNLLWDMRASMETGIFPDNNLLYYRFPTDAFDEWVKV